MEPSAFTSLLESVTPPPPVFPLDKYDDGIQRIFVYGEITEAKVTEWLKQLHEVEHDSEQPFVLLLINSEGGCLYSGMMMVQALLSCSKPVVTVNQGLAASAAGDMFLAGSEGHRYMSPLATLLLHDAAIEMGGSNTVSELVNEAQHLKEINTRIHQTLSKHLGRKRKYITKVLQGNTDMYFTPEKAMALGFVNHIGTPHFGYNVNPSYSVQLEGKEGHVKYL